MMYGTGPAEDNAPPDASSTCGRDTTSKRPLYQILSPFPHSTRTELDTRIGPRYGNHTVIAEGADLDIPHRNAWIFSDQSQSPPLLVQELPRAQIMVQLEDGTWEKRAQSPEPEYEGESDGEVLHLDSDIMERNLDTDFIGECGRGGCRRVLGCVDCKGKRPISLTPRSAFREACSLQTRNSSPMKDLLPHYSTIANNSAPGPRVNTNESFPTHLQRLSTISVMNPLTAPDQSSSYSKSTFPPPRTGPKIKYIRKRAADPPTEKTPIHNRARARHKRRKLV